MSDDHEIDERERPRASRGEERENARRRARRALRGYAGAALLAATAGVVNGKGSAAVFLGLLALALVIASFVAAGRRG
jgi:hypothetical protein